MSNSFVENIWLQNDLNEYNSAENECQYTFSGFSVSHDQCFKVV